jgi:hypothetical protein
VSPLAPLLIIPKFLNPPIPKFPNPSIPKLLFLFQLIHITTPKISLSRQFNLLVRRDVRYKYRKAVAQSLTACFSFTLVY